MNRIQEWIQNVVKSVYDPAYYRTVLSGATSGSLRYFFLLMLVFTLVLSVRTYVSAVPWVLQDEKSDVLRESLVSMYPHDLVLEFRDGRVTSNTANPVFVPMPRAAYDAMSTPDTKTPANLLVIDTTRTIVPEDLAQYDTMLILGSSAIWVNDPENGIQVNTFEKWGKDPFTIDRALIDTDVNNVFCVVRPFLIAVLVLLPVFIFFAFSFGYLFYLLFGALIVLAIAKARKYEVTYAQAYRLGLHLLTVPVGYALLKIFVPALDIPFVFSFLLALFAYVNLVPAKTTLVENIEEKD